MPAAVEAIVIAVTQHASQFLLAVVVHLVIPCRGNEFSAPFVLGEIGQAVADQSSNSFRYSDPSPAGDMPPKHMTLLRLQARTIAQWLRGEDWVTRHEQFNRIAQQRRRQALIEQIRAEMTPDELIGGQASAVVWPHGRSIPLHNVKRRRAKQTKITDYFKKAPKKKVGRQMKLERYFVKRR